MLLLALLLAVNVPRVEVARGLGCPTAAEVERALAASAAVPPGAGWRIVVEPVDPEIRLRLIGPDGAGVLERTLALARSRCDTGAMAIALVVERYFRALGPSRRRASAPPPAAVTVDGPGEAPWRQARPRLVLLVGPVAWTRRSAAITAAAELRVRIAGPLHGAAGALVPGVSARQDLPAGGVARTTGWPFIVRLLVEERRSSWLGLLALDALTIAERGVATGIAHPSAGRRLMTAAGLSLGVAWSPTPSPTWRLALEAGVVRSLVGSDFAVAGVGRVLGPPAWQGLFALRLGWVLWR
jgi:hypothetical protein